MLEMELKLQALNMSHWTSLDPTYLIDACELLIIARRKLKWTFAHAYFLDQSPEKGFFEFLQVCLCVAR